MKAILALLLICSSTQAAIVLEFEGQLENPFTLTLNLTSEGKFIGGTYNADTILTIGRWRGVGTRNLTFLTIIQPNRPPLVFNQISDNPLQGFQLHDWQHFLAGNPQGDVRFQPGNIQLVSVIPEPTHLWVLLILGYIIYENHRRRLRTRHIC